MKNETSKTEQPCTIQNVISRFDALKWWNEFSNKEKLEMSLKHYNVLDLNVEQIIIAWRRTTGGEWS
tara:strand:+ start:425 stop:625 length:201 start_codon:yes stop_codon:yes gene_type:complete